MYSYCMYHSASVLFSVTHRARDFYHSELLKYYNVYVVQWLRERCLLCPHQNMLVLEIGQEKCAKQIKNDALDLVTVLLFF